MVAIGGGSWWFWSKYLPKQKLGEVELNLLTAHVCPEERLQAEIVLQPKTNVSINAVVWKVWASEIVVRGHGTDKTTHSHTLFEKKFSDHENEQLKANQPYRFTLEMPLPADAPPSIDLSDNDLKWKLEARIDIPKWPDWKKQMDFQVLPTGTEIIEAETASQITSPSTTQQPVEAERPIAATPPAEPRPTAGVTFDASTAMVAKVRTDFEQLDRILAAVTNQDMEMTFRVDRPISLGAIDPDIGYSDGKAYEGYDESASLPLHIYVPATKEAELDESLGNNWNGWGQIIGYDHSTGSLQIKVV